MHRARGGIPRQPDGKGGGAVPTAWSLPPERCSVLYHDPSLPPQSHHRCCRAASRAALRVDRPRAGLGAAGRRLSGRLGAPARRVDASFFPPWHGVLSTGVLAVALPLLGTAIQRVRRGAPWQAALPPGSGGALAGVGLCWAGGVSNLVWQTLFGSEDGVDALISPPHLLLMGGVWRILSGPCSAAWQRPEGGAPGWWRLGPAVLALTGLLSIATLLFQIAHPVANLWGAGGELLSPR